MSEPPVPRLGLAGGHGLWAGAVRAVVHAVSKRRLGAVAGRPGHAARCGAAAPTRRRRGAVVLHHPPPAIRPHRPERRQWGPITVVLAVGIWVTRSQVGAMGLAPVLPLASPPAGPSSSGHVWTMNTVTRPATATVVRRSPSGCGPGNDSANGSVRPISPPAVDRDPCWSARQSCRISNPWSGACGWGKFLLCLKLRDVSGCDGLAVHFLDASAPVSKSRSHGH